MTTWQPAATPIFAQGMARGFTGHEHLDSVSLIHMNGRVYDPVLGRFLSADPTVQFPDSTQGLNRYEDRGDKRHNDARSQPGDGAKRTALAILQTKLQTNGTQLDQTRWTDRNSSSQKSPEFRAAQH